MISGVDFSKQISSEQRMEIFRDYFEQHMLVYNILKDIKFVNIMDVSPKKKSILYSVRLLCDEDKQSIIDKLNSASTLNIYGNEYTVEFILNGDLLCISIE